MRLSDGKPRGCNSEEVFFYLMKNEMAKNLPFANGKKFLHLKWEKLSSVNLSETLYDFNKIRFGLLTLI